MYHSLITLQLSHQTVDLLWNRYRVHQCISDACAGDARLLFRIEYTPERPQIVVQSHLEPVWEYAFGDLEQVNAKWQVQPFEPELQLGARYRFQLLANPTYKKNGKRWGIRYEKDLVEWLNRKLRAAGASLIACSVRPIGFIKSFKDMEPERAQQHWAVWFVGELRVEDAECLRRAVENGIGPAKGYGFGLLSLLGANGHSEGFSPHAWG
jgi:CRISPR system Cascade subunit CasE